VPEELRDMRVKIYAPRKKQPETRRGYVPEGIPQANYRIGGSCAEGVMVNLSWLGTHGVPETFASLRMTPDEARELAERLLRELEE
jgi:hypothetical protein